MSQSSQIFPRNATQATAEEQSCSQRLGGMSQAASNNRSLAIKESSAVLMSQAMEEVQTVASVMRIWNRGIDLYNSGNLKDSDVDRADAITCFDTAVEEGADVCDELQIARMFSCTAIAMEARGGEWCHEALHVHRKALGLAEQMQLSAEHKEEAFELVQNILSAISANEEFGGDLGGAIETETRLAQVQQRHCKNSVCVANTLARMGTLHKRRGELPKALAKFKTSLKILCERTRESYKKQRKSTLEDVAQAFGRVGDVHLEMGDLEAAKTAYEKAVALNKKMQKGVQAADYLSSLCHIHAKLAGGASDSATRCKHYHRSAVCMEEAKEIWLEKGGALRNDQVRRAGIIISSLQRSAAGQRMAVQADVVAEQQTGDDLWQAAEALHTRRVRATKRMSSAEDQNDSSSVLRHDSRQDPKPKRQKQPPEGEGTTYRRGLSARAPTPKRASTHQDASRGELSEDSEDPTPKRCKLRRKSECTESCSGQTEASQSPKQDSSQASGVSQEY